MSSKHGPIGHRYNHKMIATAVALANQHVLYPPGRGPARLVDDYRFPSASVPPKCKLPDCQVTTKSRTGFCCAEHWQKYKQMQDKKP